MIKGTVTDRIKQKLLGYSKVRNFLFAKKGDIVLIFLSYSGPSGILGSDGKQNTA